MDDEKFRDALLNIQTGDRGSFSNSERYHRYEPTPYHALDFLFENYTIRETDCLVDFGCGKGRVPFYANYYFHTYSVGIERDEKLYKQALENKERFCKRRTAGKGKIKFFWGLAEDYQFGERDNIFYFFNPFTSEVFMWVINNLLDSVMEHPRTVDLLLYYPHETYVYFLENQTPFILEKEICIPEKFPKDPNERFLIYRFRDYGRQSEI